MVALTNFQTIALIVAAVTIAATIAAAVWHSIEWRTASVWILLWIAASVAVLRPSITVTLAHFLGIGRGADLVFYCGILGMLIGFFALYVRMKRLEHDITKLVRRIAISEIDHDAGAETVSSGRAD
jgi:small membrane protein